MKAAADELVHISITRSVNELPPFDELPAVGRESRQIHVSNAFPTRG